MKEFDEKTASKDELWEYCLKEYENKNPLIEMLVNNIFKKIERIVSSLGDNINILEIGCGAGESSRRIAAMLNTQHFEVSEFDERYVNKLKEINFPFRITQESVYTLKREDNEFDCVLLLEVLEHLDSVHLALRELFRVSRKYVVISIPHEPLWRILNMMRFKYLKYFGNTPGHINHWSKRKFKRLISNYGRILEIYTPIPWIVVLAEKN